MSNDIEYYEFTYKIPKYKIKPPLNFCKYYQIHKDEIIIDLQQENKQLKSILTELEEWLKEHREICKHNANIITEGSIEKKRLNYRSIIYEDTLYKIQELKEKYKC